MTDLAGRYAADADCTLPDWADSADLGNGYEIATCYGPDGTASVWLVAQLCEHHARTATHGSAAGAHHERLGRLPAEYRAALGMVCGRPTHYGRPCRQEVKHPGDACRAHRGRPASRQQALDFGAGDAP